MALREFIADESEPSLVVDLSNLSYVSSSISTEDEDINKLLRRASISLFNMSTPLESYKKRKNNRSGSSNIHSGGKKRTHKPLTLENQEIQSKEQNNNLHISPNLSVKYIEALKEIESLQIQLNKLKSSERSTTPLFVRRKSQQSSMIKTCLFKNSSTALRPNQQSSSISTSFGADSTCMTIDIEDQADNEVFHDLVLINNHDKKEIPSKNLFLIKSESSTSNSFNNSDDPLIFHSPKTDRSSRKMRNFMDKFLKCPEFLLKCKNYKHRPSFSNKVSPIPRIVIQSPKTPENDSGNDSDMQQRRLGDFNCNTPNVEKLMKDMSKCAKELSELSEKLNMYKNVLQTCMTQKTKMSTS